MENTSAIVMNEYQTPLTDELLRSLPEEVKEELLETINSVPLIKRLISPTREYAKDRPRDEQGRIIVDLANPHILEDMDYFRQPALHFMKHGCYTFLRPNSNPNSEYRKHWDEERRRCWEGYVRESDGEWVTGYCYWFMNYCPMMINKILKGSKKAVRIESFPFFFEGIYWRFHYLYQAREAGKHAIELAKRGAHPYFQKVFTPDGWKSWGDVNIGDKLFGTDNSICTVTDIPYDKVSPYYRITLRDGRVIYATDDHLWNIERKGKTLTVNTEWLLSNYKSSRRPSYRIPSGIEYTCYIPKNSGVPFSHRETLVDPYTFGLLLGDGCFCHKSCYFAQADSDFENEKDYIPYNIVKWNTKYSYRIDIPNWGDILHTYGLTDIKSSSKFIPDEYKYNSKEVRLNVLKGLLDTDGSVHGGVPILNSVSKRLIEDAEFIARSLGYNTKVTVSKAGYKKNGEYKQCQDCYELAIYGEEELFNLPRKKCKVHYNSNNALSRKNKTCIVNVEYVGEAPCKCVTVDSKDSCYLIGDFVTTHNCAKSYSLSAIMTHNLILGESEESKKRIMTILAAYQKEFLKDDKDGTLSKFRPSLNFVNSNTPFPRLLLKNSPNEMSWQMGYKDEFGRDKGSLNTVMAVAIKEDEAKLRGKRGIFLFEEMGTMPNLLTVYDTCRRSVEDGDYTFGQMYLVGTANEDEADFSSAKTLLYNPDGYNILAIENVYDRPKQGKPTFGFFFPSYVNRAGCYNKDGVSDVTKALIEILLARHKAKYSADPKSVLRVIAEDPVTPAEAIIKVKAAYFPTVALTERLAQLDSDPHAFDDVYIGNLALTSGNKVEFRIGNDVPIRKYGVDNSTVGALEIFEMPEKQANGENFNLRYIIGHDPVDNDQAESSSLSSTFVLDLFTDRIVAEYTGRQAFAEDNYEIVRLLCLFYNAKCMYESNKKGIYAYFSKMQCTHLLADTPEYLRDKQMIKYSAFGSNAHPYYERVYTPQGLKSWGDINIGDTLFSPDGTTTKVIDIPIDEELDIYRVTLRDGRTIEASSGHLWEVYKFTSKKKTLISTIDMLKSGILYKRPKGQECKFYIKRNLGVDFMEKSIPINPYLLGLMLGDGTMANKYTSCGNKLYFTSSYNDMMEYMEYLHMNYKQLDNRHWSIDFPNWGNVVKELGLAYTKSSTKFIPDLYKYNSREIRLEILRGLLDTDGTCPKIGSPVFTTTSEKLAKDVLEIARSLGIIGNLRVSKNNYGKIFQVILYTEVPLFRLQRKLDRQVRNVNRVKSEYVGIVNIEYIGKSKAKCVTVDREDGLYLIGDFVTTHNCKGINASAAINNYANSLIRDWLLQPVPTIIKEDGEEKEVNIPRLYSLRNRALLEELISYTPELNVDRIRALGMVMLYRQEKIILYKDNLNAKSQEEASSSYLGNDSFFQRNFPQGYMQ